MKQKVEHYTVSCTSPCTECGGARVVANPLWQKFYADTKTEKDPDPDAWARAHGYANAMAMGREEEICGECDGLGYFQYQVPLADALMALGLKVEAQAPAASAPVIPALQVVNG
jgi:hypothetical protein